MYIIEDKVKILKLEYINTKVVLSKLRIIYKN